MQKLFQNVTHYTLHVTRSKGFTLVELLVVISIIAILASVVTVNVSSSRQKARDAKRTADLLAVQSALELYYADNKSYPSAADFKKIKDIVELNTYLTTMPQDPLVSKPDFVYQYKYVQDAGTEGCAPPFYVLQAKAEKNPANETCYQGQEGYIYVVGGR